MRFFVILCLFICMPVSADVWKDDFERDEIGEDWISAIWWGNKVDELDWIIEEGVIKGKMPEVDALMLFAKNLTSTNYTMQVKCRLDQIGVMPEASSAGFIFRSSGPPDKDKSNITPYYAWTIGSFFASFIVAHDNNNWAFRATSRENHKIGEWYNLKLVVKGSKFSGFVNEKAICHLEDERYKGGFAGLFLAFSNASFDDFMFSEVAEEYDVISLKKIVTVWGQLKYGL